jgi:hypothetical protein
MKSLGECVARLVAGTGFRSWNGNYRKVEGQHYEISAVRRKMSQTWQVKTQVIRDLYTSSEVIILKRQCSEIESQHSDNLPP